MSLDPYEPDKGSFHIHCSEVFPDKLSLETVHVQLGELRVNIEQGSLSETSVILDTRQAVMLAERLLDFANNGSFVPN